MARETTRIGWIDWARALGAGAIVFLHVLVSTSLAVDVGASREAAYAVLGIVLTRWAVPSFFMLSGMLLLDPARPCGWPQALRHARRMVVVLATFGLAFALMEEVFVRQRAGELFANGAIGAWDVLWASVVDVVTFRSWDHLWYVYAQAGVYLASPLVASARARLGEHGFVVLTACLATLVLGVPTVAHMVATFGGIELPAVLDAAVASSHTTLLNVAIGVTCFCVGGCLGRLRLCPPVIAAGVGSLAVMVATVLAGAAYGDQGYVILQGSCFACLYAVLVLLLLRERCSKRPLDASSPVSKLARDGFGVYLIHPFFVHVELMLLDPLALPPVLYEAGSFAVVLVASVVATHVLRRVPVVRDVL